MSAKKTQPIEVEGRLAFDFDRAMWSAAKWDDEPAYRQGFEPLGDHNAVDLLARHLGDAVYLVEVKDPRGHWVEYRDGHPNEELADLVARKVRDTIAGVVWAQDRHDVDHLASQVAGLVDRTSRPFVILWLEAFQLQPAHAITLKALIEKRLRWLNPRVVVTCRAMWRGIAGLEVRSLADAPWQG